MLQLRSKSSRPGGPNAANTAATTSANTAAATTSATNGSTATVFATSGANRTNDPNQTGGATCIHGATHAANPISTSVSAAAHGTACLTATRGRSERQRRQTRAVARRAPGCRFADRRRAVSVAFRWSVKWVIKRQARAGFTLRECPG